MIGTYQFGAIKLKNQNHMNFIRHIGVLILALMGTAAWAQTVSGTVTDENNQPFPGTTVLVQGTDRGTTTDFEGRYRVNADEGETLVFSYVGYAKQNILIGSSTTIDVQMVIDNELEEVIVIGYGTTTKETFVGTATKVTSEDIENKNTTNISQALAGEVAGVTVINGSGQPGTASGIRIRGFGSISGNRSPLYVIDGIPFSGNINSINKSDIESYTVLKDASATAIYGSRGANGVVLITTKKGKAGKSQIEISVNQGSNNRSLPEYQTIKNQEQYVELGWESLKNYGIAKEEDDPIQYANDNLFSGKGINANYNMWNAPGTDLIDPATGKFKSDIRRKYTPENWADYLFSPGNRTEVDLRMSGGVEKTTYSTSFGFLKDEGYLINSSFERYSSRVDVSHEAKEWLKGRFNLGYAYINSSQGGQASNATSAFWFANSIPSIYPVFLRDADGNLVEDTIFGGNQYDFGDNGRGFGLGSNPVATTIYDINQTWGHEINGNTSLEASFLKNFKFRVQYGLQYRNYSFDQRRNKYYGFSSATGGSIFKAKVNEFSNTFLQSLSYKNTFDLHTVEAKLFHESQTYDYYILNASKNQLADPNSVELNNAVVNLSSNSYKLDYAIESFFGTIDYNYDEKYFASFVTRRDGSSRFRNNKWGTFFSVGASWLLSKEDFLSSSSWVNFLKVKTSYGTTGDQAGAGLYSGFTLAPVINLNDKPAFGAESQIGNPNLTWEESVQFQFGTEFELFERFEAELDYYIKTTDNLLVPINVGPSLGYRRFTGNDGSLRNSGFEFNLTGHIIKSNDLNLELNLNGAFIQNKILAMPIDAATGKGKIIDQVGLYGRAKGKSIFDHYIREFAGVSSDTGVSEWYVNYTDNNKNGSYDKGEEISSLATYMAENPNKTILEGKTAVYADATERYIGTSAIPDIQGAFRIKGDYKGFELSAQFLYQFGGTGYDFQYANLMGNGQPGNANYHVDILNRWQKNGDVTNVPRLSANADTNVNSASSRFLISSDYLALNNLRIGYTFSERLSEKLFVEKLSVWTSGDNLWLNSKRDGFNPTTAEASTTSTYNYAPLTTIVFGLKVQF